MLDALWGLLLDLDDTLVWTAELEKLRTARVWPEVYRNFFRTTLPPGTLQFVAAARRLAQLGVVTMAPRQYADRLLAFHGLSSVPVLVAYHDVRHHKPYPEPILTAASRLACLPSRCFYVGDRPDDMEAARRAEAIPIGMVWPYQRARTQLHAVQHICHDWDEVLAVVSEVMVAAK
jgi:HAD superfamily hydrolase (TIGR01549 family)